MIATTGLVDFHCHSGSLSGPCRGCSEADAAGVFTLAVTTTPRAWPRNHELAQRTKHVRAALGLHPQLVAERENEIELWDRYLSETRYVGEVGLDAGPRFFKSLDAQKRVFQHVLQRCAEAGGKIITVHSIRSAKAVLDLVEAHLPPERGKIVLHWFTGTKSEAKRALGAWAATSRSMQPC
jgi:TatD DNase family protein